MRNSSNGLSRALCFGLLATASARAEGRTDARAHFAHGVELVQRGDLDEAASEFETAYRISPNYSVLYNLGQAYFALGKPVEAVRVLEKYLEVGGAKIGAARRSDVQNTLSIARKRIGIVSFSVEPASAELLVDGQAIDQTLGASPVALVVGTHGVTASAPGYVPFFAAIRVESSKSVLVDVRLERPKQTVVPALGRLNIECTVPAIHVSVDRVEMSSQRSLLVAAGHHEVRFERNGYTSDSVFVDADEQRVATALCALSPIPNLPASQTGILAFTVSEPGAEVQIDGRGSALTVSLPPGPHDVLIRHPGFLDWTQSVVARPGFPQTFSVRLRATPTHARELSDAARSRRTWSYIIGGTGLSFLGLGTALYLDNSSRYASWDRDRGVFDADLQRQQSDPTLGQRGSELQTRAAGIQQRDDLAIGAAVLGGGLLAYAVGSWLNAHP